MKVNDLKGAAISRLYYDPSRITSNETIIKAAEAILESKLNNGLIDQETFNKAMEQLEQLEKSHGGEGSRGGHIIGHTRSGKAIYEHADHKEHKGFTSSDHEDAAKAHRKIADDRYSNKDNLQGKHREHNNLMIAHHTVNSYKHDDAAEAKSIKPGTKVKVKNTGQSGVAHYKHDEGHYVKFKDGSDGFFQEHHLEKE